MYVVWREKIECLKICFVQAEKCEKVQKLAAFNLCESTNECKDAVLKQC